MSDDRLFVSDLETVAFGCHGECHGRIRDIFDKHDLFTYSLTEYFLDEPVIPSSECERRKIFFPFLSRAAMEYKYRVESTKDREQTIFRAKTREWLRRVRDMSHQGISLDKWPTMCARLAVFHKAASGIAQWQPDSIDSSASIRHTILKEAGNIDPQKELSYHVQVHLWSTLLPEDFEDAPVRVLRVPIASKHTCYGQFLICYHAPQTDVDRRNQLEKELRDELHSVVKDRYLPTLILLHVSKWERKLRAALTSSSNWPTWNDWPEPSPLSLDWCDSSDEFESAFGHLWKQRKDWVGAKKGTKDAAEAAADTVKKSIILDKYQIASPGMVDQVRKVIRGTRLMAASKVKGHPLPSALVFGEAGSGKDDMARLIPTLTKDFWHTQVVVQNMAGIKPAILAMPLMFGVEFPPHGNLPGLFSAQPGGTKVFILDELNSLDYDMQGSLLRLLENSETAPLFCAGDAKQCDGLVVGIVNEDPEEVTRENELRLLKSAEEFLGKAEAARLYDALHRTRRLRPDLVYRLKRGLYVRMPPLRERREDIPLIFKRSCDAHLKTLYAAYFNNPITDGNEEYYKWPQVITITSSYELEAYTALMSPEWAWPGNIRQLQTVAADIAGRVWECWKQDRDHELQNKELIGPITTREVNGEAAQVTEVLVEVRRTQVEAVLRKTLGKDRD